jgi:hypothetical protein
MANPHRKMSSFSREGRTLNVSFIENTQARL